ncbi:hypothetical protein BKA01_000138 [Pseudonocardia eucalypti]|nr:hypothetical protein [Pseudonocardia eucalypti]
MAVLTLGLFGLLATLLPPAASAQAPTRALAQVPAQAPDREQTRSTAKLGLRIDSMEPRVVTSSSPAELTVTGVVINTGDQPVKNLQVRAQRGDRLRTDGEIRTALTGAAADDAVTPGFADVADQLAPGEQHPVRLVIPLRGSSTTSLALQRTGVYELLINVNGSTSGGGQTRLAAVRTLLPVLGLPAAAGATAAQNPPVNPQPATKPTAITMLYPLADQPRRLPTGPGEPVLLGDDELATSLAQGGRLSGLVGALEVATPPGSPVRDAVCLAVDPDLLRTVRDMSQPDGYRVRGPDGAESAGRGAQSAKQWLDRLRAVAAGRCVIPIPYADADLVALSRAGLDDLARYATKDGARIATEILGTPVRADTVWPADGLLDERALTGFLREGGRSVVLSADSVNHSGRGSGATTVAKLSNPAAAATGLLADPLLTQAAEGQEEARITGSAFDPAGGGQRSLAWLGGVSNTSPAGTGAPLSAQDVIGTLAHRVFNSTNPSVLLAPPHLWNTPGQDAQALLGAVGALVAARQAVPAPLPTQAANPGTGSASLVYSLRAGAREVPTAVTNRLRQARDVAGQLRGAAQTQSGVGATVEQVFDPVTEAMLRGGSAMWRGQPELARNATTVITQRVQLLRSLVRVMEPPTPYAFGAEEAPLPITLANGLPVAMRVKVALAPTPGLRTEPIEESLIPPFGRLPLKVNAQLSRAGSFSVEARLTTPAGAPLGVPSRLLLRSTAYGTITVWLTGTAFLLLVILAVRRIIRRVRRDGSTSRVSGPAEVAEPTAEPILAAAGAPSGARRARRRGRHAGRSANPTPDPTEAPEPTEARKATDTREATEAPTGEPEAPRRRTATRAALTTGISPMDATPTVPALLPASLPEEPHPSTEPSRSPAAPSHATADQPTRGRSTRRHERTTPGIPADRTPPMPPDRTPPAAPPDRTRPGLPPTPPPDHVSPGMSPGTPPDRTSPGTPPTPPPDRTSPAMAPADRMLPGTPPPARTPSGLPPAAPWERNPAGPPTNAPADRPSTPPTTPLTRPARRRPPNQRGATPPSHQGTLPSQPGTPPSSPPGTPRNHQDGTPANQPSPPNQPHLPPNHPGSGAPTNRPRTNPAWPPAQNGRPGPVPPRPGEPSRNGRPEESTQQPSEQNEQDRRNNQPNRPRGPKLPRR